MRFCSRCDNMLYISLQPDESRDGAPLSLTYSCKHCGFKTAEDASSAPVLSTNYADDQTSYKQYATPFIRFDPTLPRVSDIKCPSAQCSKPADAPNEVIYVKYDPQNLRFLYYCVHCATFWKSGGGSVAPAPAP